MKKLVSILLAMVIVLSISVSTFANTEGEKGKLTYEERVAKLQQMQERLNNEKKLQEYKEQLDALNETLKSQVSEIKTKLDALNGEKLEARKNKDFDKLLELADIKKSVLTLRIESMQLELEKVDAQKALITARKENDDAAIESAVNELIRVLNAKIDLNNDILAVLN